MKIKPLATNRLVLTWLSICSATENTSKWKKCIYMTIGVMNVAFLVATEIPTVIFFCTNVTINFGESLYSLFQFFGCGCTLLLMVNNYFLRQKINDIFKDLANIYENCKNYDSIQKSWFIQKLVLSTKSLV